jgi:xanthine dehydrogenase molybdopterin-binding subunit B
MSTTTDKPTLLPGGLNTNRQLAQWLQFFPDGRVRLLSGKVEIGQGILHALAQIAAQELAIDLSCVDAVAASTVFSPNEALTSVSLSVQDSGIAVRLASRHARLLFTQAVAAKYGVAAQDIELVNGQFMQGDKRLCGYGDLCQQDLDRGLLLMRFQQAAQPSAPWCHSPGSARLSSAWRRRRLTTPR